jgi:hypothetical protein
MRGGVWLLIAAPSKTRSPPKIETMLLTPELQTPSPRELTNTLPQAVARILSDERDPAAVVDRHALVERKETLSCPCDELNIVVVRG